jgi:hypothetical protein
MTFMNLTSLGWTPWRVATGGQAAAQLKAKTW